MKIAIPTNGTVVEDHFGHCDMYTIFNINKNLLIEDTEIIPAAQGCGCKSNIAEVLQQKGVEIMLAGNMGEGAVNVLQRHGIEVVRACKGEVIQIIEAFLKGQLSDSGISCLQHQHHHGEEANSRHECKH
ncbi:MAG: NifB/NifX family molybdenum-iron cluster-binding protein [Bacteroidetes bacterium]|nr:NifB/NifX family molybdenum-iron cluster-binding protein [Bacteroidota bacterium]MBL6963159.1 NifB/NifX family molybdenum-iron cluster-binding protein [Bacteroidota bacterium]